MIWGVPGVGGKGAAADLTLVFAALMPALLVSLCPYARCSLPLARPGGLRLAVFGGYCSVAWRKSASLRTARARCETAFFSSVVISAKVFV